MPYRPGTNESMSKLEWRGIHQHGWKGPIVGQKAIDSRTGFSYEVVPNRSGGYDVSEWRGRLLQDYPDAAVTPRYGLSTDSEAKLIAEEWVKSAPARRRKAVEAFQKSQKIRDSGIGRTRSRSRFRSVCNGMMCTNTLTQHNRCFRSCGGCWGRSRFPPSRE